MLLVNIWEPISILCVTNFSPKVERSKLKLKKVIFQIMTILKYIIFQIMTILKYVIFQIMTIRLSYKLKWREARMILNDTADWSKGEINISPDNIKVRLTTSKKN